MFIGYANGDMLIIGSKQFDKRKNEEGTVFSMLLWQNKIYSGHQEQCVVVHDLQGQKLGTFGRVLDSHLTTKSLVVWKDVYIVASSYSSRGRILIWRDDELQKRLGNNLLQ